MWGFRIHAVQAGDLQGLGAIGLNVSRRSVLTILGLYMVFLGIMEKKMETTIL